MTIKSFIKTASSIAAVSALTNLSTISAFAEGCSSCGSTANAGSSIGSSLLLFGVVILFMYFIMIRPQRKKEKETKSMQNNIQIGDEIVTIGGIVGMVVRKGDDNVVIETGGERNKLRIKLWAISENTTVHERLEAEKENSKKNKKSKKTSEGEE